MPLSDAQRIACFCALLVSSKVCTAKAIQVEVFVDVDGEQDLYDLLASGQLSERTFDALLSLMQTGVDLNHADRERLFALPNVTLEHVDAIVAVRAAAGTITGLNQLVAEGAIDAATARTLTPFVIVESDEPARPVAGFVRALSRATVPADRWPPTIAAQARVRAFGALDLGALGVLVRNDLGRVRWDQGRRALASTPERPRVLLPKVYAQWKTARWGIVVGTYRIGFGQRLTFDVTDQAFPNGFLGDFELRRGSALVLACRRRAGELVTDPCPDDRTARVSPDYRWSNRLTGAAMSANRLEVGRGWFQVTTWGSYQVHRALQTELVDASLCPDPRREDERCRPPTVYVIDDQRPSHPAAAFSGGTLARIGAEGLAGANVAYAWDTRMRLGVTGYGAVPRWRIQGVELGFQETARRPFGGPFGAVGVDASLGGGAQDFFVEVTRSLDAGRGGGWGAVFRSITTLPSAVFDVTARYYGREFANPYARPIAAPDEFEGLRARDELGGRAQVTGVLGRGLSIRAIADVWRRISVAGVRSELFVRLDGDSGGGWSWAIWATQRRTAEPRFTVVSRVAYDHHGRIVVAAQYAHHWVGSRLPLRQNVAALAQLVARPRSRLRIRMRARYDLEDIAARGRFAEVLWGVLEVAVVPFPRHSLRVRYDARLLLDGRVSTAQRLPNPEHWIGFEYRYRY